MFIGDSMITPAISVLSAVEGLKLVTPALEHYVVPLTVVILVLLFAVQSKRHRDGRHGLWAGDGALVRSLAVLGVIAHQPDDPTVLAAINPLLRESAVPAVAWRRSAW